MRDFGRLKFLVMVCFLAAAGSITAKGQRQDSANLPLLSPVEKEMRGGETHSYRVSLKTGQFLFATVEQKGIDVVVVVFGPEGKQISESDSPNDRWGSEPIQLIAPAGADYRVEIRSPTAKAPAGMY